MEDLIIISNLNDFIFCPVSIYFHNLYGSMNNMLFQETRQIKGTSAHSTIDNKSYSTKKDIYMSFEVFCEKYSLVGKIDMYDKDTKTLTERKRQITTIYDGYVFQLYAQYFALVEMGYKVEKLKLYSMADNKSYKVALPMEDEHMLEKFEKLIMDIKKFDINAFTQDNENKCKNCIYEPACDRSLIC